MNGLMLDTNVLIHCFVSDRSVGKVLSAYERILLNPVVLAEFRSGIHVGTKQGKRVEEQLSSLLNDSAVSVVPIFDKTADLYARIYRTLKAQGTPIPVNDMWIAASALEQGVSLFTFDAHFSKVPMLDVIVPSD